MAIEVHVILSGIVSLIPRGGGTYLVRLQNGSKWSHKHYPNLLVQEDRFTGSNPKKTKLLTDNRTFAAWLIPDGEITIQSEVVDSPSPPYTDLRAPLKIVDGAPDCGKAKKPKRDVELVVMNGSLLTTAFTPAGWYYDHQMPKDARVLDHEICWTFSIKEAPLVITFPGPLGKQQLKAQANGHIELRLQNTPLADLFPRLPESQKEDHHVMHYFEQAACADAPKNRYLKVTEDAVSTPGLPKHSTHDLDGLKLALLYPRWFRLAALRNLAAKGRGLFANRHQRAAAGGMDPATPRLNCPPALWESLET
ncbi:MAG TPA: hypothetical protein VFS60_00005 [Thermoanaerobaculia bacterium]|nr:hypothetical protein [Thermoanaerobaculia bacterium]